MRTLGKAVIAFLMLSGPSLAETTTLIMGIEDYDEIADVRRGDDVNSLVGFMRANERLRGTPDTAAIRAQVDRYEATVTTASRQLIVLSGRFVHSASETYFLPSDTGPAPLTTISRAALPLSTVLAFLAETPGESVLVLATDDAGGSFGAHLTFGVGDIALPQGVTLLEGDPRDVTRAISTLLREPGSRVENVARRAGLDVSGFIRNDQVLRDVAVAAPAPQSPPQPAPDTGNAARLADLLAWREADRANTADAYEAYIDAYPTGQFVRMAQGRIEALLDTPEARAEREEQRLDLNRDQRRNIQRALTILDYDTRGIDGIFGRGTRAAIAAWQRDNRYTQTGFLDEQQLRVLANQARERSAQLEAEAEARREAQAALDRAFWQETGVRGDAAGYRAYLEQYPDGEYSDIARERLKEVEREKRRNAEALDRDRWTAAQMADTVAAYRDYIEGDPDGQFQEEARARIRFLRNQNSDVFEQARREEDALNMSASTRRLVEARLARIGLDPGRVDGDFTNETRRAIRRYQRARDLPQTGYVSEAMIVRLLADSVRSLIRQ